MANEGLFIDNGLTGSTLFGVVINSAGQVNLSGTNNFENWGNGGNNADDYDFAVAEVGSGGGVFIGSFPTTITTVGRYKMLYFLQLGANPADSDNFVWQYGIDWNGSREIFVADLLQADRVVVTTTTPWTLEIRQKDTKAVLLIQTLKNTSGENITGTNNVLGRRELSS